MLGPPAERSWRWWFLAGLFAGALIWLWLKPSVFGAPVTSLPRAAIAGLLVGLGTQWSNGCTSGHGVCGLSRFSGRSLANVLAFMGAGFLMVFVLRHLL